MRAPVLTPVTTVKSGRVPDAVQPASTPAPYAPSWPPPERASHDASAGPGASRTSARKSSDSSAQRRTPGMPRISATAAASGETGVRGELGLSAGCAAALPSPAPSGGAAMPARTAAIWRRLRPTLRLTGSLTRTRAITSLLFGLGAAFRRPVTRAIVTRGRPPQAGSGPLAEAALDVGTVAAARD